MTFEAIFYPMLIFWRQIVFTLELRAPRKTIFGTTTQGDMFDKAMHIKVLQMQQLLLVAYLGSMWVTYICRVCLHDQTYLSNYLTKIFDRVKPA